MRVVHVHRIGGIGGSERHLLTLLPALAERGLDVRFVGLDNPAGKPDPFYAELQAAVKAACQGFPGKSCSEDGKNARFLHVYPCSVIVARIAAVNAYIDVKRRQLL